MVARWVQELTEEVMGGPPVEKGKRYVHPEDGVIEITGGQYWGTHGLSNHWSWTVVATGEKKYGYGDRWPAAPPEEKTLGDVAAEDPESYEAGVMRAQNPDGPQRVEGKKVPPPGDAGSVTTKLLAFVAGLVTIFMVTAVMPDVIAMPLLVVIGFLIGRLSILAGKSNHVR